MQTALLTPAQLILSRKGWFTLLSDPQIETDCSSIYTWLHICCQARRENGCLLLSQKHEFADRFLEEHYFSGPGTGYNGLISKKSKGVSNVMPGHLNDLWCSP